MSLSWVFQNSDVLVLMMTHQKYLLQSSHGQFVLELTTTAMAGSTVMIIKRRRRILLLCVVIISLLGRDVGTLAFLTTTTSGDSHCSMRAVTTTTMKDLLPRRPIKKTTTRRTSSTVPGGGGGGGDLTRHFSSSSSRKRLAMAARAAADNNDDLILIPPPLSPPVPMTTHHHDDYNDYNDDDATTTAQSQSAAAACCLILIPGCQLRPAQYEPLARAIQAKTSSSSQQRRRRRRLYIGVSSQPGGLANPHTIAASVAATYRLLQRAGYRGRSAFIGGHSLGGAVLPYLFDRLDGQGPDVIDGFIHLGCIDSRGHNRRTDGEWTTQSVPHLVCVGDLDGLVRSSRLAEDYYQNVVMRQGPRRPKKNDDDNNKDNECDDPLRHVVISVPGMNHFGIIQKQQQQPPDRDDDGTTTALLPSIMAGWRDLPAELSFDESIDRVSTIVADFIDCHSHNHGSIIRSRPVAANNHVAARDRLTAQMNETVRFLQPLLDAMQLEGSYHLATPCHLYNSHNNDDDDPDGAAEDRGSCTPGSPWVSRVQTDLLLPPEMVDVVGTVTDEFHQSWWINPLADPPFYHPIIQTRIRQQTADNNNGAKRSAVLDLTTMSEAVYEKPDFYLFDAGFFSNAAIELRSKLHSKQSLLQAAASLRGDNRDNVGGLPKFESERGIANRINQYTIDWAVAAAPERVRRRYFEQGTATRLVVGTETEHTNGPSWIWSYLTLRRVDDTTMAVDTHIMSTSLDHPFPFSQGKLYCKLLSPAKALDWMYTDALRRPDGNNGVNRFVSRVYNEELLSPAKFFNRIQQGANAMPFFPLVVLNQLVARGGKKRCRGDAGREGGGPPPPQPQEPSRRRN